VNGSNYSKTNGWRQGNIIDDKSSISSLIKNSYSNKSFNSLLPEFLIIITQDCDIFHHNLSDEPYIDFIKGYFQEEDGNLLYGKNPRRLQIKYDKGTIGFFIHDVFCITKDVFEKINPKHASMNLKKEDIKQIVNWVSKRYVRAAFPDEFNNRLSKAKQVDRVSRNLLMCEVSLIYIDLPDEELKPEQDYEVTMVIGVRHRSDQEIIIKVEDFFYNAFNLPGIKTEVKVYDEYDITYETISTYKRFDLDYRSVSGNPDVAAPVSGIDMV
jgi:hypothetical protein